MSRSDFYEIIGIGEKHASNSDPVCTSPMNKILHKAYKNCYPKPTIQCRGDRQGLFTYEGWMHLLINFLFGSKSIVRWGNWILLPYTIDDWKSASDYRRYCGIFSALNTAPSILPKHVAYF